MTVCRRRLGLWVALGISSCYEGVAETGTGLGDSSSGVGVSTTPGTTMPGTTSPGTTSPGTTSPGTSDGGASTTEATTSGVDGSTTAPASTSGLTTGLGESSGTDATTGGVVDCPYPVVDDPSGFDVELVGDGLNAPLFVLGHPTEPERLFVLEQGGVIRMIEPGNTSPVDQEIADIGDVLSGGERGLLGMAFHPDFPADPRIYLNYTASPNGRTRIEEYALDPSNGFVADPLSARIVLEIHQPASNHNGGGIAFDFDGQLVIGMGDGGMQSTSRNNGILLAKFLRIGVEPDGIADDTPACNGCPSYGPFDYTIPADNPFVGVAGYAQEILAGGFRNPWRWSLDVQDGGIWIGDVGEVAWEEIDLLVPGRDYGWNDMEGFHCYADGGCDDLAGPHEVNADGLAMPLINVAHSPDCAIVGGAVYRSCEAPSWSGTYFYSDYCNPDIRAIQFDGDAVTDLGVVIDAPGGILGNGWNQLGDVYFTGQNGPGRIWRIVPVP